MKGKEKNTGLFSLLVVFMLISLGLGCFIYYDKLMNKGTTSSNQQSVESNIADVLDKNTACQVLDLAPIGGYAVVYNGEVYVNVYDSTANIDKVYGNGSFQKLINTRNNNYKEYVMSNLEIITSDNEPSKWLKLEIANVKSIFNNIYGQALSSANPKYGILILTSDATVSYIGINDLISGKINPTKLDAENISIVKSENNNGYTTYLVKEDASKIDVNTLIK